MSAGVCTCKGIFWVPEEHERRITYEYECLVKAPGLDPSKCLQRSLSVIDGLLLAGYGRFETERFTVPEKGKGTCRMTNPLVLNEHIHFFSNYSVSFLETLEPVECLARAWGWR
jgi:hypothetical protein